MRGIRKRPAGSARNKRKSVKRVLRGIIIGVLNAVQTGKVPRSEIRGTLTDRFGFKGWCIQPRTKVQEPDSKTIRVMVRARQGSTFIDLVVSLTSETTPQYAIDRHRNHAISP